MEREAELQRQLKAGADLSLFQSVCLVITRPRQIKADVYDSRVPLNIVLQSKLAQRRQTNPQKVVTMQTQVVQSNPLG